MIRSLRSAPAWATGLGWGLAFGLAHSQLPLYSSNQNSYFLHGLARAGHGFLSRDWMAGTTDPFPLFTAFVWLTARWLHPVAFHLAYLAVLGVYFHSLRDIVARCRPASAGGRILPLVVFVLHSAAFAYYSSKWTGTNLRALLTEGFAGQYLLGPVLQPSVLGTLLLLSIGLELRNRPGPAVALAGLASWFHPSYLLSSAILILAILGRRLRGGETRTRMMRLSVAGFLLLLPVVVFLLVSFPATSPGTLQNAREILVDLRIPHHARPAAWFDGTAILRTGILGLGLLMLRKRPIAGLLLPAVALGTGLTLLQIATQSRGLALVFPWRISVWVLPVLTVSLVTAAAAAIRSPSRNRTGRSAAGSRSRPSTIGAVLLVVVLVGFGLVDAARRHRAASEVPEAAVISYAAGIRSPDDLYLVPPELETFRIGAGVPVLVDFKTHPYRDAEVVAWFARLQAARRVYAPGPGDPLADALGDVVSRYGITHLVVPIDRVDRFIALGLRLLYRDAAYAVLALA